MQTTLYNRQEDQQRKIMVAIQDRLGGKHKTFTEGENVHMPNFVLENLQPEQMTRDELDIEYSKITPEMLDLLDDDAKADIKLA